MKKRAWKSKINWLGLLVAFLGMVTDPDFQQYLGSWLPAVITWKLVSLSGMLIMIFRTWSTSQAIGKEEQ